MQSQLLFGHHIEPYFDTMIKDLETLISIPSVCSKKTPEAPFGKPCTEALDFILNTAERLGLDITNTGYYAGDARLGHGSTYIDVLTHIDVVPAGDVKNWDSDPFTLTRRGEYLYGRGTADDKGAAIAALYSLKALKDAKIEGNYCLRAVFGCGEEIGSDDLDVYYGQQGYPCMGFTPDCSYGICCSEKGILRIDFAAPHTEHSVIESFQAGTAVNSVPNTACALLSCSQEKYRQLKSLIAALDGFTLEEKEGLVQISANGRSAHGAEPELGENAASKLLLLLHQIFPAEELGPLFSFAAEKIGMEYQGKSLGVMMSDKQSGPLTLNLGIASAQGATETISVDIRYPVTADKEQIITALTSAASAYQVKATEVHHMAPLYIPRESRLISCLSASYQAVTGKECNIYSTGGGTYARHAKNTVVAFGPVFPEEPSTNAHGPNERLNLDSFRKHSQICLEAMYRLFIS